jgi:translocation and assembly module TamA
VQLGLSIAVTVTRCFKLATALALLLSPATLAQRAYAFDFFGLLGAGDDTPEPNAETLPYKVEFAGLDQAEELLRPLQDASNAYRLRKDPPAAGAGLARRAVADIPRLAEALWGAGYFDAAIVAEVAGVRIDPDGRGAESAAAAAERLRGAQVAPLRFRVTPGPQFKLRKLVVYDSRSMAPIDRALFPKKAFDQPDDSPARAAALRSLQAEWIDALRANSFPLAKVVKTAPVIDHDAKAMDVAITIDPGPKAGIGEVIVKGSPGVDPDVIRSFIYLEEGEAYSPKRLAETRKAIASGVEALGAVKIEDGEKVDKKGNLPIFVETSERKRHAIGVSAQFSNVDGPSLRGYWVDRNLFGGAERLRVDLEGGLAPFGSSATFRSLSQITVSDLIGRAKVSFVKPGLAGTRNDLLLEANAVREKTDYYWAAYGNVGGAVRHRFSETASAQIGVEAERGHTVDLFGPHDYSLIGLPVSAAYDSTDNALAPTKGVRATGSITPYFKAFKDSVGMTQSKAQFSAYRALDEDAWYVLAGRVGFGSILGPGIADIPASHRFFAGGGGSVRGYRYRSLSPYGAFNTPVGGRSLLEFSAEARIKVTENIGIVPFYDTGAAFESSYPDFRTSMRSSVGIGLRYYTAIGPIRLDVATPIGRRPGESRAAVFIGIGESF